MDFMKGHYILAAFGVVVSIPFALASNAVYEIGSIYDRIRSKRMERRTYILQRKVLSESMPVQENKLEKSVSNSKPTNIIFIDFEQGIQHKYISPEYDNSA